MRLFSLALCVALAITPLCAADKALQIYFIDVEGGQATLFVPPHGQSLLIDTGWGYNAYRDANRIAAAAKLLQQPMPAGAKVRLFTDGCSKWEQYPGGAFFGWLVGDVLPDFPEHAPTRLAEWLLRVVQEVAIKKGQVEELNQPLKSMEVDHQ